MFKTINITPKRLMFGLVIVAAWALLSFVVIPIVAGGIAYHDTLAAVYATIAAAIVPAQIAYYVMLCAMGAYTVLVVLLVLSGLGRLIQRRLEPLKHR